MTARTGADDGSSQRRERLAGGRYVIERFLAEGGMGTVFFGRFTPPYGFSKLVAIKRLRADLADDAEMTARLLDEARLMSRIQHANVVNVIEVIRTGSRVDVVMELVKGVSLDRVLSHVSPGELVPPPIAVAIVSAILDGLHAAHEACDAEGNPLHLVHRDVSPQNILLGADGAVKVTDFGIAKARARLQTTAAGVIRGKLGYLAPEQLTTSRVDRRADVYSAGVVLWELLTGGPLLPRDLDPASALARARDEHRTPPSAAEPRSPVVLDPVVLRALALDPRRRFATAEAMSDALRSAIPPASAAQLARWLRERARDLIEEVLDEAAEVERYGDALGGESEGAPSAGASVLPPARAAGAAPPRRESPRKHSPEARARRARTTLAVLGGALVLGLGLAVVVTTFLSGRRRATEGDAVPPASLAPSPEPPLSAATSALSFETRSATPPDGPPAPANVSRGSARPPASVARPSCDVPYVIDTDGRKIYRRECL